MEGGSKNDEACPQLLNLIPKEREWFSKRGDERSSEEKKLELRLGPPGDQDWSRIREATTKTTVQRDRDESLLSLGYFTNGNKQAHHHHQQQVGAVWFSQQHHQLANASSPSLLHFPSAKTAAATSQTLPVTPKESSQPCCTKVVADLQQSAEKKAFSPPAPANTPVPNSSQKRCFSFFILVFFFCFFLKTSLLTEDIHSHVHSAS
ncbi:hypothetical protein Tsubulata_041910 [Turnera subulata]|uniref:Uncharacterized protein n=1 Tax=Turnera subulata TaxID=218843 RepID=A0A9Q0JHK7_9ROSI|nr:hypothetical protein Tsubulata_041910 [Turnera subulata]